MTEMDIDYDMSPGLDPQTRACLSLWAAVFHGGVTAYRCGDAVGWFWDDGIYPGSFRWLCELFDLDPDVARTFIDRKGRA